jgi:hypothetical protein
MEKRPLNKAVVILIHAFVGWAFCAAIMGIGMAVTSLQTTLILHAIGGPIGFIVISLFYFKKFGYTSPLQTAIWFIAFVVFMDIFIVALLIEKSFAMFRSVLGTWLPFSLIFLVTYFTGRLIMKRK